MSENLGVPDQNSELKLLTVAETAQLLRISKRTVHRIIRDNHFPAIKVGGQWRIRESKVREWIKSREEMGNFFA